MPCATRSGMTDSCNVRSANPRSFRLLLIASWAFVAVFFVSSVRYARMIEWNGMRVAPAFAFRHEGFLYPSATAGVITGNIYPPLATLAYLPCTLFRNPTFIMECGCALACFYYFLPLALAAGLSVRRWGVAPLDATLVVTAAALWTLFDPALRYTAFMIHAEAPGFALAGLALCTVLFAAQDQTLRAALIAGMLCVCAILTKQTFVGVWCALAIWLTVGGGLTAGVRFGAGSAIATAVFGAALLLFGDWRNFVYNCLFLPSQHPWETREFVLGSPGAGSGLPAKVQALVQAFLEIAPRWFPGIALAGWGVWLARGAPAGSPVARAALPAWVFVAQLPLALMAYSKIGGDVNGLAVSLYFLIFALVALALSAAAENHLWLASQRALLAALLVVLVSCNTPRLLFLLNNARKPDPHTAMVQFLHAHPQQVYLPWNPLHTRLADGVTYHFEYGVFDRALANVSISSEHFRAHLPTALRYVAVRRNQPDSSRGNFRRYLPDLREIASPAGLEDWRFFEVSAEKAP